MLESTPIYLIGSIRLETALTQMGLEVFRTKVSEVAQISAHVRLVILDGDDLGDFQTLATIEALQDCKPYLDVVVFKPDADASYVHTILKSGAADVVYENSLEALYQMIQANQAEQTFSPTCGILVEKLAALKGCLVETVPCGIFSKPLPVQRVQMPQCLSSEKPGRVRTCWPEPSTGSQDEQVGL